MSHITLIRPPMVLLRVVHARSTCPPLGIAYLAGSMRSFNHDIEVIDAVGESIFQFTKINNGKNIAHGLDLDQIVSRIDEKTDFICLSTMFSIEWPLDYELIKKIKTKFPEKLIIIGGEHVTATADWIMKNCPEVDYCVLGEGEVKLVNLINFLSGSLKEKEFDSSGIISREYKRPERQGPVDKYLMGLRIKSVDDIPLPAWDLIPLNNYLDNNFGYGTDRGRNMPMLATRGCPYQCTFCSNPQMWSTRWVARDPVKVLNEMETYIKDYRIENFSFYDLTAIVKRDWIITFCNLILERKLNFTWQLPSGTRSEAFDEEVVDLMYRTGCRNLNFAPESGSPSVLKRIKKKIDPKAMLKAMKICLNRGMVVKSNIIIGFPKETHFEIWQSLIFLAKMSWIGVHDATVSKYYPYPGTEMYDNLRKEHKISDFSDSYFWSLSNLTGKSYSEYVSTKAVDFYSITGLLIFYVISIIRRPQFFFKSLYNVVLGRKEESRMEATIRTIYKRFNPFKKKKEYI
jgi:anaerobic magnesium-protoporphyrin IX monomethyl ester cyclase